MIDDIELKLVEKERDCRRRLAHIQGEIYAYRVSKCPVQAGDLVRSGTTIYRVIRIIPMSERFVLRCVVKKKNGEWGKTARNISDWEKVDG